jgi:hypothetical protein
LKNFRTSVEVYFVTSIDGSLRKRIVILFRMNLLRGTTFFIVVSLVLMAVPVTVMAQMTGADAASLQKKASEAQARIHANKDDRDQLMIAVKTNEVPLAKEVLLRNGFTAEDLENAKITLRTGGGKGGENEIEISAACCDPKEIVIQRTLPYFTK